MIKGAPRLQARSVDLRNKYFKGGKVRLKIFASTVWTVPEGEEEIAEDMLKAKKLDPEEILGMLDDAQGDDKEYTKPEFRVEKLD